jgi:hypothetical protein
MALRRTPLSAGVSESSIVFFNGGHNHNGTSSSLIDTSKYSLYDFTPDFLGTEARRNGPQANNSAKFQEVIAKIVKEDVLSVSGIDLLPNQIKAVNIAAGIISSDLLSANLALINNIIYSSNWDGTYNATSKGITDGGTTGWAISSNGDAYFANTSIRGTLEASSVVIDENNFWSSDGTFQVGSNTNILAYSAATDELSLTGYVYANGGRIAGWNISGSNLSSGGEFDGEMVIGPGYGPASGAGGYPSGAMFVSASFDESYTSEINYNGLYTSYSYRDRTTEDIVQTLEISADGITFPDGPEKFSFAVSDGVLYAIIDGSPYCISECGNTIPATTTVVVGAPAVTRYCLPGDIGFYGCDNPGECREGASGALCSEDAVPTTVTTVVSPTCSTCTIGGQYAVSGPCGGGGCFQIWETRTCAAGCTCDGTCVNTMIEDCTGPGCGVPPSFFAPPTFFAPPDFFSPPAFK